LDVFLFRSACRQSPDDYVYADAVVTCDPRDDVPGQDWIDYPTLVVEVLAPSTERYDRAGKFEGYKNSPAFREYVLVEYRRREGARLRCGGARLPGPGPPQSTGRPMTSCWTAWP
jgi:Uma2 family endonuclease